MDVKNLFNRHTNFCLEFYLGKPVVAGSYTVSFKKVHSNIYNMVYIFQCFFGQFFARTIVEQLAN